VGGRRTPWGVVVAAVLSALVAGGALIAANQVGDRPARVSETSAPPTSSVGPDGCRTPPCTVLGTASVGGTTVQLVADKGARSGRLRIGGPDSGDVIDATVTDLGVTLAPGSLQCVAGTLSACLIRGGYHDGTAGQVVVGRSGKWSSLTKPFVSDAGLLVLAQVTADVGPEVIAVQRDCDRATVPDCSTSPVFAQVFTMNGAEAGCTGNYQALESLPGYPDVRLRSGDLSGCG
jgi:hypothetical protein